MSKRGDDSVGKSWSEIAGKLGVTRQALYNWRKLPEAPTEPNWDAWAKWAAEYKPEANDDLTEVKRLVELEKLRKLKRENETEEGAILNIYDVDKFMRRVAASYDILLTQKLDVELPPLIVGQDIVTTRKFIAGIHDEIRTITQNGLLDWADSIKSS